ncbi:MAG: hypothetical protein CTY37_06175 [Methylotenera sp.]|nr:MAG: hypothetical protein CTY37_06175 [Methylotenera sp.]
MASISQRTGAISDKSDAREVRALIENVLADNTALRTALIATLEKIDVLTAKLNADAGVTDTNYAVNFASTLTPAALTLTA